MVVSGRSEVERVVLGTVQLGMAYGRRAALERPARDLAFQVLDAAWSVGIRSFDTAEAYGEAASRLSQWIECRGVANACQVVTKVPGRDVGDPRAVERALWRFRGVGRCTVMTHGAVDPTAFAAFRELLDRMGASAGASVYTANEVEQMALAGACRIQAPVNAFDARQFDAARRCGVPIDGRSVFLQGILLESPAEAESRAPGTGPMSRAVQRAAAAAGLPAAAALLATVLRTLGGDDRVVVGVDGVTELDDIVRAVQLDAAAVGGFVDALHREVGSWMPDERTLDPRTWSPG